MLEPILAKRPPHLEIMNYSSFRLFESMEMFAGLPSEALSFVAMEVRREPVAKGQVIFEQGARAERAYALGEGSVRMVQTGADGAQIVVRFIGRGDMFGTVPLFTDHLFPADAIAAEPSLVLSWSEADLLRLIDSYPLAAMNVIRALGARLSETQNRVRELSTQGVERRMAHALLRLMDQAGKAASNGTTIHIRLRRQDLAEVSGTTLHTASRLLAAWQKAGFIVSHNQHLTVQDVSKMRSIADGRIGS